MACKSSCAHPYKIDSWGYVGSANGVPSVDAIKTAIYQYGPVAVAVAADSYFQSYTGGVFNRNSSSQVNHAVVLVGWDDSQQCWILRNSWGSGWGESGYMRIKYGVNQVGYGATYVVYKGGSTPTRPRTGTGSHTQRQPLPEQAGIRLRVLLQCLPPPLCGGRKPVHPLGYLQLRDPLHHR